MTDKPDERALIAEIRRDEIECPECGSALIMNEDMVGVVYQCTAHGCFACFDQDEIERGDHTERTDDA